MNALIARQCRLGFGTISVLTSLCYIDFISDANEILSGLRTIIRNEKYQEPVTMQCLEISLQKIETLISQLTKECSHLDKLNLVYIRLICENVSNNLQNSL